MGPFGGGKGGGGGISVPKTLDRISRVAMASSENCTPHARTLKSRPSHEGVSSGEESRAAVRSSRKSKTEVRKSGNTTSAG